MTAPLTAAPTTVNADAIVRVRGLSVRFGGAESPPALDGVDLDVQRGEALGVVGESGSGKTLLMRSIMGMAPPQASITGSVHFEGTDVLSLGARARRRLWGARMAMVVQNPMTALDPLMRLGRQVAEPLRAHRGLSARDARTRAGELFTDMRIPDPQRRLDQRAHELSGGMRQRVLIAAALAADPTLLLADEPTTALDVTVQAQILDLLDEQRARRAMTMVLVTHDLGVVAQRTDRVIVMYAGRIVESAPTHRLFRSPRMPYTAGLLASIPRLDQPPHTPLTTIPGRLSAQRSTIGCAFADRCSRATEQCTAEEPPLTPDIDDDHAFRCWHPLPPPELTWEAP